MASVSIIAFAVGFASPLPEKTAFATADVILLMAVLTCASFFGLEAGIVASIAACLAFDFFFLLPYYSLTIADWEDVLALLIFGFGCGVVCLLAGILRDRARSARYREVLAKRLQATIQRFSAARDAATVARSAVRSVGAALGARAFLAFRTGEVLDILAAHPKDASLSEAELAKVSRPQNYRRLGSPAVGNDELTCSLLPFAGQSHAILIVGETTRRLRPLPDRLRIMDVFAGQAAAAFERVTLAGQIQEANIAAEMEKFRSALLTALSHDLKTPLSVILGSASSLVTLKSDLSEDATQDLHLSILEEGKRLDRLIANLLDMSRVESDAVLPKRQYVELEDVVRSALHRARRLLSRHRIVLRIPTRLPLLEADPVLLEKVFFNLLENAAKYTPDESNVTLSAASNGDKIAVSISDEGPGIPEAQMAQLFKKFHRMETGGRGPAGTGLGLAICRGFLQAMGGSVSAANQAGGRGAIFTITLPAAPQNRSQVAMASAWNEKETPLL